MKWVSDEAKAVAFAFTLGLLVFIVFLLEVYG